MVKEKEEEESKLKGIEQEAAEVKEMKAKLAQSLAEAKQVAGVEKMLRKKDKDQKTELANLETELKKMKKVVESAVGDNAKLSAENEILASTLSTLEAEVDAVKKKRLNFGEELNQMTQAQREKVKLAEEKKDKLVSEVAEAKKKIGEADQENEKLTKELQESQKMKMEKSSQLEEKKKSVERLSSTATSCNTKPQTPAFTPTPSSRPRLKTPSASPLKAFRESRANLAEKNATTSKKTAFDFESSSDEKQPGARDSFTTPRKEKKLSGPITPRNTGKPQPSARSGTSVCLIMLILQVSE